MNADDRQAILGLISGYSYGYDTQDWDLIESIFPEDAVLAGARGESVGRTAVVSVLRRRRERLASEGIQTRHYQTNTLLNENEDGTVSGRTLMFVAWQRDGEPGPEPMHTGEYRDRFVHSRDGWHIARRELVVDHD